MANRFVARAHLMLQTLQNPTPAAPSAGLATAIRARAPAHGGHELAPGPPQVLELSQLADRLEADRVHRRSGRRRGPRAAPGRHRAAPAAAEVDGRPRRLGQQARRVVSGRPVLRGAGALSGPRSGSRPSEPPWSKQWEETPGCTGNRCAPGRISGGSLTFMSFDARDIPPEFFERRKPRRLAGGFRPRELFWPIRPMEPSTPSIPPMRVPELESAVNPFPRPRRGSRLNAQPDDPEPEPRSSGPSAAPDRLCRLGSPTPMPDPAVRLGRGFPQSSLKGGKPRPSGAQSLLPD